MLFMPVPYLHQDYCRELKPKYQVENVISFSNLEDIELLAGCAQNQYLAAQTDDISIQYMQLLKQIEWIKSLENNWNSYGAIKIENSIIENASNALGSLFQENLLPNKISPTSESIIFEYYISNNYFLLEFFDDNNIVLAQKLSEVDYNYHDFKIYDFNKITEIITEMVTLEV